MVSTLINSLILLFLITTIARGKDTKHPILLTKQDITKIRYISQEGNLTLFQTMEGELKLVLNYKLHDLIKGERGDHYVVIPFDRFKKLVILKQKKLHLQNNANFDQEIYLYQRGEKQAELVGIGIAPKLHLNGSWISFFHQGLRALSFVSFIPPFDRFEIKIKAPYSPFFRPQVVMVDNLNIYYTDRNRRNQEALLHFSRQKNKVTPIVKSSQSGIKMEICLNDDHLYLAQMGLDQVSSGTSIGFWKIGQAMPKEEDLKNLYNSTHNDVGQLNCHFKKEHLYFIKRLYQKPIDSYHSELFELNHQKVLKQMSHLQYVTNFLQMDQSLLIPYRENIYVIVGDNDYTDDQVGP